MCGEGSGRAAACLIITAVVALIAGLAERRSSSVVPASALGNGTGVRAGEPTVNVTAAPTLHAPSSILISVAVLGRTERRKHALGMMLREFSRMKCEMGWRVTLCLEATEDWSDFLSAHKAAAGACTPDFSVRRHSRAIGWDLLSRYRTVWKERVEEFEWFLFLEDDLNFTADHLRLLSEEWELLNGTGFQPGLLRYQHNALQKLRYLEDVTVMSPMSQLKRFSQINSYPMMVVTGLRKIRGEIWMEPSNQYAAYTLIPRAELRHWAKLPDCPVMMTAPRTDCFVVAEHPFCHAKNENETGMNCLPGGPEPTSQFWPPLGCVSIHGCALGGKRLVPLSKLPAHLLHHMSTRCDTQTYTCQQLTSTGRAWTKWFPSVEKLWQCLGYEETAAGGLRMREGVAAWNFSDDGRVQSASFPASFRHLHSDDVAWGSWRDPATAPCQSMPGGDVAPRPRRVRRRR